MKTVILKVNNLYPPRDKSFKLGLDRIRLKAGSNFLSDAEFAKICTHPEYSRLVDRQALIIQEPKETVEPVPLSEVPANLAGYNVDAAQDIIDNTHDVDVLRRWLTAETRKTTRQDLEQRIQDLTGGDA